MANTAMELFLKFLEAKEISASILNDNTCRVGFSLSGTGISIFVEFSEDGTSVHFTGLDFVKIPEGKQEIVYKVCNQCNAKYRYVKFYWNETENAVVCDSDAVIQLDSCSEECFRIIMTMGRIVDDAYPLFMKAIWS